MKGRRFVSLNPSVSLSLRSLGSLKTKMDRLLGLIRVSKPMGSSSLSDQVPAATTVVSARISPRLVSAPAMWMSCQTSARLSVEML